MFFGKPIIAFDCIYNRATTHEQAYYFMDSKELQGIIEKEKFDGAVMRKIAEEEYTWKKIANQYENLY
jgi:glycosyltransferase involved in cell wall biosynthesis